MEGEAVGAVPERGVSRLQGLELLAPAGSPDAFRGALAAGADAIFCAPGHSFNARRAAEGFDRESFARCCREAHLLGVRVYVTENVVIREDEMPRALALAREAWILGADALIIQDFGLLAQVRRLWPQIECHLSTQANVHDARAVRWAAGQGVSRVTLSRELSLKEIATIAREGVELEVFAHGALCFCYSGVCLMSSLSGGRSANRGLCAQPCRLPYDLVDEKGVVVSGTPGAMRPLCTRDLCTIDRLDELWQAGVTSLKLEGRMKAPDYVYETVGAYRSQLDDLMAGRAGTPEDEAARHRRLSRAFNRSFTSAYLDGRSGNELMSYERSNNRGELVGEVVSGRALPPVTARRGGRQGGRPRRRTFTQAEVTIRLDAPVGKGDLLELRPDDDPSSFLTTHVDEDAQAGALILCKTARPMAAGCPVRVIRSQEALDRAARAASGALRRRLPVDVHVRCRLGRPLAIGLSCVLPQADGPVAVLAEGPCPEPAMRRATTREDLVAHAGRMGGSPFVPASFTVDVDEGCAIPFSAVHEVRTRACELLEEAILAPYDQGLRARALPPAPRGATVRPREGNTRPQTPQTPDRAPQPELCALVENPAQARAARDAGATRLYAPPDALAATAEAGTSWPGGAEPIPWLDEVCREADHAHLDPWICPGRPCAVGNVSELVLARERGAVAEVSPCIPAHNTSCLATLEEAGARTVWLSPELTLDEFSVLAQAARVPVGLFVLGRTRAMTSEHCVLQVTGRCVGDCRRCGLRTGRFSLCGRDGATYPVRTDIHGRSRIYAARPLDLAPELPRLISAGVGRFMADCTLLSAEATTREVERLARALKAAQTGAEPPPRENGATSGHLFKGIA